MSETLLLIIAVTGAIVGSGGAVAFLRVRSDVAKTEAETESIITVAAERAVGISQIAIKQLETELVEQKARRHDLENELSIEKKERAALAARVTALESWIRLNTSADPEAIE